MPDATKPERLPPVPQHPVCRVDMPPLGHVIGVASLVVVGFGVPAIWYVSGNPKIDTADRWVMRGVAGLTALVTAPLSAYYIERLRR